MVIAVFSLSAFFFFQQKETIPSRGNTSSQPAAQVETPVDSQNNSTGQPVAEQQIAAQQTEAAAAPSAATQAPRAEALPAVVTDHRTPVAAPAATVSLPTLRKELQALCQPVFDEQLGAYRDSSYQSVGFIRFDRLTTHFKQRVNPLFDRLWEQRYKATGGISERVFSIECVNTCHRFINNLYDEMVSNDR